MRNRFVTESLAYLVAENFRQNKIFQFNRFCLFRMHGIAESLMVVSIGINFFAVAAQYPFESGAVNGVRLVIIQRPMPPDKAALAMRLKEAAHLAHDGRMLGVASTAPAFQPGRKADASGLQCLAFRPAGYVCLRSYLASDADQGEA